MLLRQHSHREVTYLFQHDFVKGSHDFAMTPPFRWFHPLTQKNGSSAGTSDMVEVAEGATRVGYFEFDGNTSLEG